MKKQGGVSPFALALIVLLIGAILLVGILALANRQTYQREAAITPTPSITPRTVLVTQEPGQPTWSPTPALLKTNSTGVEVRQLQARLQELGYYSGALDGEFGSGTRAAVEAFQRQNGLEADGIAGDSTLALLYSSQAQPFVATSTPEPATPTPAITTLSTGAQGEEVKRLQTRLQELGYYSGAIDGDFGKGTKSAVVAFQRQHGLDADGIAGAKTQAVLYSDQAASFVATPTPAAIAVLSGSLPMLVNKDHPVSADFVPAGLVDMSTYCDASLVKIKYSGTQGVLEAVDALMVMLDAARKDGVTNWQVSAAYRSYADQERIFNDYVNDYMKTKNLSRAQAISATRLTVADPGTSEHHTGLAFDMTVPGTSAFAGTEQCKWLHAHCWEYGFIIRYTDEKQDITGFLGEEWHIRYVGVEHSLNMRDSGLCLEEYLQYAVIQ
ncbi:MAG: peptidoglycan-binding protein [Clostridia bacterium]|nr:peptidoglycan-binding protein [Clostridia bacterium]